MKIYLVHNAEYPFDFVIGMTQAETPDAALQNAIKTYNAHVVVSECDEGEMQ